MKTCIDCGCEYQPRRWSKMRRCDECRREYVRNYRKQRKAAGNPLPRGSDMPREWHQQYERGYREREGVRSRMAARQKARGNDPVEKAKQTVRRLTRTAIESGKLTRQPCEICGMEPAHAHHDDYAKPLDVRWLCSQHHSDVHYGKLTLAKKEASDADTKKT